jgi:hypothetical protein
MSISNISTTVICRNWHFPFKFWTRSNFANHWCCW